MNPLTEKERDMADQFPQSGLLSGLSEGASQRSFARGQNFTVERITAAAGDILEIGGTQEMIMLCVETDVVVSGCGHSVRLRPRSVAILPSGAYRLGFSQPGRIFVLATGRTDIAIGQAINAARYDDPDARVAPVGEPFRRQRRADEIVVFAIDEVAPPPTNQRLKFIQSATMSINWVEYRGPRDRTQLSPHSHADFEQGSLAIEGDFVHHLRTEWKSNANLWRDDVHLEAGKDTLLIIPPELIHTTEGIGEGDHILIDIFAPPRRDFIANRWMHNETDYLDPDKAAQQ
jgi:hypothetical protein